MSSEKPIYLIAPTESGQRLAERLAALLPDARLWSAPLAELPTAWHSARQLVFLVAAGAVVRLIAPLLTHKATDPGVVVVDEAARFAISLSGGHQGGADALAEQISALLGATAVITNGSSHRALPAIDLLGKPYGWRPGQDSDWNRVAAALVAGKPVQLVQHHGLTLWQQALAQDHPFTETATASARVWIGAGIPDLSDLPTVRWHPRVLWLGVGCERGTSEQLLADSIQQLLIEHQLAIEAVAGIATLDLKADEVGILALARHHDWPVRIFDAATLAACPVPHPSSIVAGCVGTPSVAEAAALTASGAGELTVEKRVFRAEGAGACTVAIATAQAEYNPEPGFLALIGSGPGALDQLTPAAAAALAGVQVVIGYSLYIDLVRPLLKATQVIETSPITQEVARAERAIELARRGLSVAVVSSGDCGIYGMAGLVLERLAQSGWDGQSPRLEVLPGITALQAAAARVGAPLMHDFCAISLSDLMTPWEAIRKRLEAAAGADFVIALYNPRSQTRTRQIEEARAILLAHRPPETPVALVRAAFRADEQISLCTLADWPLAQVDMLTTVLIGNRATFRHGERLITPRGYPGADTDLPI